MDKLIISNLHPNLKMGVNKFELSDFVSELLQSLQDLEEQYGSEGGYIQFKKEKLQLKKDQTRLKRDREKLQYDQEQFKKLNAFLTKRLRQYEEAENRKDQMPLLKHGT